MLGPSDTRTSSSSLNFFFLLGIYGGEYGSGQCDLPAEVLVALLRTMAWEL